MPSEYIETWFNDLCWDASKITAEDERIRQTRNVNRTTEISADWSSINDIYQAAKARIIDEIPDITMMGGHSSHSYINGTNMYFNYFFNVVGVGPEEETEKYYLPIISIICEETLKRGGSIVHHHGMGKARAPWVKDEYGSSYYMLETLKHAFDPEGTMNMGTIFPVWEKARRRACPRRAAPAGAAAAPPTRSACGSPSASRSRRTTRRCAPRTGRGWPRRRPGGPRRGRPVRTPRPRRVRRSRAGARAASARRAHRARPHDEPRGVHRRRPRGRPVPGHPAGAGVRVARVDAGDCRPDGGP